LRSGGLEIQSDDDDDDDGDDDGGYDDHLDDRFEDRSSLSTVRKDAAWAQVSQSETGRRAIHEI
jgi:hypothetical protein